MVVSFYMSVQLGCFRHRVSQFITFSSFASSVETFSAFSSEELYYCEHFERVTAMIILFSSLLQLNLKLMMYVTPNYNVLGTAFRFSS